MLLARSTAGGAAARRGLSTAAAGAAPAAAGGWKPVRLRQREKYAERAAKVADPAAALEGFEAFSDKAPEAWVRSWSGKRLGIVELPREVFAQPLRADVLQRVVEWQRQKNRAPSGFALGRSEVAGSNRKAYKQKGTGNARRGALKKSPILKGGGKAMGPVVRSFEHDLPKKVRRLGLSIALSAKLAEGNLVLFDKAWLPVHNTAYLLELLEREGLAGERTLLVDGDDAPLDPNFELAARNIGELQAMPARAANVADVLRNRNLVVTLSGLRSLERRLLGAGRDVHEWEAQREDDAEIVGAFAARLAAAAEAEAGAEPAADEAKQ